jgi:dCTP deaminase
VYADILTRSRYTRLGISMNTMVQPGFRVCLSAELFNHGNSPVELVVGAKMFQRRLTAIDKEIEYGGISRKYLGNIRPVASKAAEDLDLVHLTRLHC